MATKTTKAKEAEVKETKTTAKKTTAKAATKKTAAKATETKKAATATAEKKTTAKTATKKATAKTNEIFLQFAGFEFSHDEMLAKVKADYTAKTGKKTVTSTKLYVKIDDMKIYYVVNDRFMSDVELD